MPIQLNDNKIIQDFCKMPREEFFEHAVAYLADCFAVDSVVIASFDMINKQQVIVKAAFHRNVHVNKVSYHIDKEVIVGVLSGRSMDSNDGQHHSSSAKLSINGDVFEKSFTLPILNVRKKVIGHISFLYTESKIDFSQNMSALNAAAFRVAMELERFEQSTKIAMLNFGLSLPKGDLYFDELVKLMTRYLNVNFAFIGQVSGPSYLSVDVKSMAHHDENIDVAHYQLPEIYSLPTVRQPYFMHIGPFNFQLELNNTVAQVEAQCIIATYLFNNNNQIIGILGVVSENGVDRVDSIKALLDSFALSAAREVENNALQQQTNYDTEILSGTSDLLSFIDTNYRFCAVNDAYERLFDGDKNQLINHCVACFFGNETFHSLIKPSLNKSLLGDTASVEFVVKDKNNNDLLIHANHHPYYDKAGNIIGIVMSGRDVTEIKTAERTREKSNEWLQLLYDQTPSMFFTINDGHCISSANAFVSNKLGYVIEQLINTKMCNIYPITEHKRIEEIFTRCFEQPHKLHEWEIRQRCADSSVIWVKQSAQVVDTRDTGRQILLVSEDITQKHERSLELTYQASHDVLTGLSNRLDFERSINKLITLPEKFEKIVHVLCYIDLDKFKTVNDECGHPAGDELLKKMANILTNGVRRDDVVCRIGGDEFTILMENCSVDKGVEIVNKIRGEIERFEFTWKGKIYRVGASVGVTGFCHSDLSLSEIVSNADQACYQAKHAGRNCVKIYENKLQVLSEVEIKNRALHQSITAQQFELFAQPVFNVKDMSNVVSYEFLLRMRHQGKIIPASEFISLAKRMNCLLEIDRWVINQSFEWINLNRIALQAVRCTINLSTSAVESVGFLEYVIERLTHYGIDGANICFEISEVSAGESLQDVVNFMTELAKYGTRFILDNFGGSSSLFAHIKLLPVDAVKIDGTLISSVTDQALSSATIRAINDIAHVMDKTTVATLVENEETLASLKEIGVDYVQGDLLGKPKPLSLIH